MDISAQTISALLRDTDIEGYMNLGAPSDEYDSEAHALALAFSELDEADITTDMIISIVNEVWRQSFDLNESDMNKRMPEIKIFAEAVVKSKNAV